MKYVHKISHEPMHTKTIKKNKFADTFWQKVFSTESFFFCKITFCIAI